jgi:bacteriorhodopsin
MATGTGFTLRHFRWRDHHEHGVPDTFRHVHREVYWVRYVDWLLTTPLILVDLTLLAGLNGSNLFSMIIANNIMVLSGLFSALTPSSSWSIQKDPIQRLPSRGARWGWYVFCQTLFLIGADYTKQVCHWLYCLPLHCIYYPCDRNFRGP